jgi:hypothetical protein
MINWLKYGGEGAGLVRYAGIFARRRNAPESQRLALWVGDSRQANSHQYTLTERASEANG